MCKRSDLISLNRNIIHHNLIQILKSERKRNVNTEYKCYSDTLLCDASDDSFGKEQWHNQWKDGINSIRFS